jgi:hypothetical protein
MKADPQVKSQPPLNGNGHQPQSTRGERQGLGKPVNVGDGQHLAQLTGTRGSSPPSLPDPPPDREAWRVEHERRCAALRAIYAGLPDLVVDDLEREAMKEIERLPRSGALALVVYIRRRRRKALEPERPRA